MMPKFIDEPRHYLHFATTKHWYAEDKFLNTTPRLEGDLLDAFDNAVLSDDNVRMDEEFWVVLYTSSMVVLPVDYNERPQEVLWEIE
ncbi:hypothetical protein PHMEG_00028342 [Phytophthora megakarya]|uniref:Uncharacterized protein n=1 Tax=Phytophthora megakarya TaxID=4795 RepID=A0A225V4R5_9STRA|nr:hypothetical protein PHMEG_00028342 [Phytophthora megakarya]